MADRPGWWLRVVVTFRLLGEVDAEVDGRPLELGHARQRSVLAVLLVAANQPVSMEQLARRVWGERLPQRVSGTVYSYLSRLRRPLATAGVSVVRRSGGYVLVVDPMAVDLHRFRRLVSDARQVPPDRATALFDQALGLWRGEAFAGMDPTWLRNLRHTLHRERLAAELDRNDLALAGGRHPELLEELVARSAAYPLDERLAGQLLLALYRCGQQAEALNRYERLRVRLADELGTDPGPALRRLHRQILTTDPALTVPAPNRPVARSTWPAVPHQLPAAPAGFTGRARQIGELSIAMHAPPDRAGTVAICSLAGPGGIGKSWLALRWAHDHLSRFPDGQLYVNLRGFEPTGEPVAPAVALAGFLVALGVPAAGIPADLAAQAALLRSLTVDKRMLVLLDNVRDSSQVQSLLPSGPGCVVLVTSRQRLAGLVTAHGARPLELELFSEAEASALLTRRLGGDRVAAEPDQVSALLGHCAGLPLALGVVAARATLQPELPLAVIAKELQDSSTRLDALDAGELSVNLRAVLTCSYRVLGESAAQAFGLLGLAPCAEIGLAAVASLTATPVSQARIALRELVDAHMIHETEPGRFRMHDLVRLFAGEQARQGRAAVHRVLDHYLHAACAASRALKPDRGGLALPPTQPGVRPETFADCRTALAWFTVEHQVLVAAIDQAAAGGFDQHAWQLAWAMQPYLSQCGPWQQLVTIQRTAVRAARRLADPTGQAHAHRGLGLALIWLRRFPDASAHLQGARELFDALGDPLGQAQARRSLARLYAHQGRHADALPHDQQALTLFRAAGDRAGEATVLNAVGWHLAHLGEHRRALQYCRQAVALFQQIGERHGRAFAWHSLGYAWLQLGQHRHAVRCYQRAVNLFREFQDRYYEAVACASMGDTHRAAGSCSDARSAWQHALSIFDQLGHAAADQVRVKLEATAG